LGATERNADEGLFRDWLCHLQVRTEALRREALRHATAPRFHPTGEKNTRTRIPLASPPSRGACYKSTVPLARQGVAIVDSGNGRRRLDDVTCDDDARSGAGRSSTAAGAIETKCGHQQFLVQTLGTFDCRRAKRIHPPASGLEPPSTLTRMSIPPSAAHRLATALDTFRGSKDKRQLKRTPGGFV